MDKENYFAKNVKTIREHWVLSQDDLALLLETTRGAVNQYEIRGSRRKTLPISKLENLTNHTYEQLTTKRISASKIPQLNQEHYDTIEKNRHKQSDTNLEGYQDKSEARVKKLEAEMNTLKIEIAMLKELWAKQK